MQLHTIPVSTSPSGPPPPILGETTSAILDAAKEDPTAQTQGGTDGAESGPCPHGEGEKPKSAKESTDDPKPTLY